MHQPTRYTCFLHIFQNCLNRLGQLDRYTTLYKTVKSYSASLDVSTRFFLSFQLFKQGQGYAVFTCKTKTTRNPLYKWAVGESVSASNTSTASSINEFAFSPCGHYLAVSSQDGYLRVFNYDTMELVGSARSYFGGLLCVCWSPDGKYVAVGGEDDLVTLYSMAEKRVVVRGQGHKSWVSVVAFDQ